MVQQTKPQYKYITINDFKPGIADNPGSNYPSGQAQRTNTFRCIANRQGALVPLPARDYSLPGVNYATPAAGYFVIVGFYIDPTPVLPASGSTDAEGRVHNIYLVTKYANGGSEFVQVELFRQYKNPMTHGTIQTATGVTADTVTSAFGISFVSQRILRSAPTTPGVPVVSYSNFSLGSPSFWSQFPDDSVPNTDTVFAISAQGGLLCSHQGRIIQRLLTAYPNGTGGLISTTEDIKWTHPNDSGVIVGPNVFYPEATNGYAIMASMSANELFMVKEQGAVMVAGDIENPTVVNLPMVVGTPYGQTPARSSIGLVYGTDSGVWAWSHGDSSQLLSPKMDPQFWITPSGKLNGERYRFMAWDDWVCVPDNWLYDTQTQSWWRLEDPSLVHAQRYGRFRQFMYADLQSYTQGDLTAVVGWNRIKSAVTMSWKSQPLWETIDRQIDVREVTLRAIGIGSVTVTITASNGSSQTLTFSLGGTNPLDQRQNIRVQGSEITVTIFSSGVGGGGGNPAPTVDEIQVGYDDRQLVSAP